MELEVWPPGFLLPSVDVECLQFLACVRICAADVRILHVTSPWTTPNGTYPVLRQNKSVPFTDVHHLISHLRAEVPNFRLDRHLKASELAEIPAYDCLLKDKLYPAYLWTIWTDNVNYNIFTTRWLGKQLPFGYGIYYAAKMRRKANGYLRALFPGRLVTENDIQFAVTKQALMCINLLSSKLGEKKYFFGDKPSSLDALVFGYLAPLLKLPLPNDQLQTHLKACPNLVRFVESIISIYLPLSDEEITLQKEDLKEWEKRKDKAQEELRRTEPPKKEPGADEEFPLAQKIAFAVCAIVLSLLVAVHSGLIQVEVREVRAEDKEGKE